MEEDHIKKLIKASETLNPKEFEDWNRAEVVKDITNFDIWKQQRDQLKRAKEQKEIKIVVPLVEDFFKDILKDGLIKLGFPNELSDSTEDVYKISQARKLITKYLELNVYNLDHKIAIPAINKFYEVSYETFTTHIRKYAEKIKKQKIDSKGTIIETLKQYKNGKHKTLFSCLNNRIRNAINHHDVLIDNKLPQVTYKDRNSQDIILSLNEIRDLFHQLFFLILAFDIVEFELNEPFLEEIQNKIDSKKIKNS